VNASHNIAYSDTTVTAHNKLTKAMFTQTLVLVRVQVSVHGSYKLHPQEWSICAHLYKHITQFMSIDNLQ